MLRYLLFVVFLGLIFGWFFLRYDFEQSFAEGIVGAPVDLYPGRGPHSDIDETLERLLFRSLFVYDANGQIVPDLVSSYTISPDGKIYSVTLKNNVFWGDGQPVTATDIVFTFDRDPAFSEITIEQEGEKKVNFILKTPLSSFLDVLTRPVAPAHLQASNFDLQGDTDFSIAKVVRAGEAVSEIILKNSGKGSIKSLVFKFYKSEKDLIAAAKQGEVQALSSDNFSDSSFFLDQSPLYNRYFALFFNLGGENSLIQNGEFRKAAAQRVPSFPGSPVNGPFSGTWAQIAASPGDSSSLPKFQGKIVITVPILDSLPDVAQKIAHLWQKDFGITVEVRDVDPKEVEEILTKKNFDAIILGQEVERDPDRYNLWHSSQKDFPGQNVSGYADPRADLALEEGRKAQDQAIRKMHYANFQRLFYEDNPAILIYHPTFSWWVSRKFVGPDLHSIFFQKDRFWNFSSWRLAFSVQSGPTSGGKPGE